MSFFSISSKLWSYGVQSVYIISIFSLWDSFTGLGYLENMYIQGLLYVSYKGKNWM